MWEPALESPLPAASYPLSCCRHRNNAALKFIFIRTLFIYFSQTDHCCFKEYRGGSKTNMCAAVHKT